MREFFRFAWIHKGKLPLKIDKSQTGKPNYD